MTDEKSIFRREKSFLPSLVTSGRILLSCNPCLHHLNQLSVWNKLFHEQWTRKLSFNRCMFCSSHSSSFNFPCDLPAPLILLISSVNPLNHFSQAPATSPQLPAMEWGQGVNSQAHHIEVSLTSLPILEYTSDHFIKPGKQPISAKFLFLVSGPFFSVCVSY